MTRLFLQFWNVA